MLPLSSAPVRVFVSYSDLTNINYKDISINFDGESSYDLTNPYCFVRET